MRVRLWLGLVASQWLFGACTLTTDLDGLSSGGLTPSAADGGGGVDGTSPVDGGGPVETGAEAGALAYAEMIAQDHPIGHFAFDEAPNATLVTEKISGKNATSNPAHFTSGVPGIAGNALRSSGDGVLDFGDMLDLTGNQAWSLEAWVKPEFVGDKVFYEYFNKREGASNGLVAYVRNENGTRAQVEQSYGGAGRGTTDTIPAASGRFIHLVFVYTPTAPNGERMRLWVNGEVNAGGYDDPGGPTDHPQSLRISGGFRGVIDELALYDYALPEPRIQAHRAAAIQPP